MIYPVLIPLLAPYFVPVLANQNHNIHTVNFVLLIPLMIFLYFIRYVGKGFEPLQYTYQWIPSLDININFYLDGLSLLFVLLISGIGFLVVLYSIYYLDRTEALGHFYVYLLLF